MAKFDGYMALMQLTQSKNPISRLDLMIKASTFSDAKGILNNVGEVEGYIQFKFSVPGRPNICRIEYEPISDSYNMKFYNLRANKYIHKGSITGLMCFQLTEAFENFTKVYLLI